MYREFCTRFYAPHYDYPNEWMSLEKSGDYSMLTAEQAVAIYKELTDTCIKRVNSGLDCSRCPFENSCDDVIRGVVCNDGSLFDR